MRMIWAAAAALAVVFFAVLGMFFFTSHMHDDLQRSLNGVEKTARAENWEWAGREAGNLEKLWDRADRYWSPVMDHECIDRVDETITRVIRLSQARQKEELLVEIGVARRQISRLKEREFPNLRNVF